MTAIAVNVLLSDASSKTLPSPMAMAPSVRASPLLRRYAVCPSLTTRRLMPALPAGCERASTSSIRLPRYCSLSAAGALLAGMAGPRPASALPPPQLLKAPLSKATAISTTTCRRARGMEYVDGMMLSFIVKVRSACARRRRRHRGCCRVHRRSAARDG